MDYQNQKATMKPDEVFIGCSQQGKFRVRVGISHLACSLTTFRKLTLTFRDPQSKGTTALLSDTISIVSDIRKFRLPDILVTNFGGQVPTGPWA